MRTKHKFRQNSLSLLLHSCVNMFHYLEHKVHCFKAGGLRECCNQWQPLTLDPEIPQMILGRPIELTRTPYQRVAPSERKILDLNEKHLNDTKIKTLLAKGVITPSSQKEGEYISLLFSQGLKRMALSELF